MSLPDWESSRRGSRGGVTATGNEREERRLRDTPLQNLEKKLRMLNQSDLQTPLTSHRLRQSPPVSEAETPLPLSRGHGRASRNDSNQQLSTIIAQRDAILHKDLELSVCLTEIKSITTSLSNMSEVVGEIESHISSEGGLEMKALLKLTQPLKKFENSSPKSDRDLPPPRELLILSSATQKLSSDLQSVLQVFTQCLSDSSRAYQEQLAHAKERSNMATRNALQAEKASYHSSLLQLKEQHTKDLRDLAEVNMKSVLESESKIRSLTLEFDELRASSQLVSDLKREVQDVEERIHRAAEKAREEERHRSQRTIQEVREQCQVLLKEAEETLQSRQRNVDDYHQEKLVLQKQHHEEMIQLLRLEREKVEKQNADLVKELHLQRENFLSEKEKLLQETAAQRQRVEREADEMRAEHLQTVSSLKAEMATKMRQLKAEERQRVEDALLQFRREKEQQEAEHAAEMERTLQHHKSTLSRVKAQLEVKHEDEMKTMKRRHEHEVSRYSSEIDRLRRLIARRGVGGLDDPVEDSPSHSRSSLRGIESHGDGHENPRHSSPTPAAVTPQPHSRSTLTDRRTVNFQSSPPGPSPRDSSGRETESRGGGRFQRPEPILRISDPDRSFSFSPTKSLDWTMLKRSMELQEEELSKPSPVPQPAHHPDPGARVASSSQPKPSPAPTSRSSSSRAHAPSPKAIGSLLNGNPRVDQSLEAPPPPPPDTFPLEVAWQTSKIPGHNVASNATKVESYLSKLQRYLEGDQSSGAPLSQQTLGPEEEDDDIAFPSTGRLDQSFASEPEQDSLEFE